MGQTGSVDDTVIASLIWDSPSHHHHSHSTPNPSPNLQRSPLHKSTSALTDLQEGGVVSTATPTSTVSHFNYQGQPHLTPHNSREYYNRSASYRPPEDVFSPPSSGATRNQGAGLPDFDLANEIFQHFSGRSTRRDMTPPPSNRSEYLSSRQTPPSFPLPPSPLKRTSSPDLVAGGRLYGDQRARSNSPDMILPTPEHHRHWQPYSNSHQQGTPGLIAHPSTPPSRSSSKSNYRGGSTGAAPQSVTSPPWYDGASHHHQHHSHPHIDTSRTPHREEGGAYRQGQQQLHHSPKPAAGVPLPRRQNEESLGIQEFLTDLASSRTNPFNDGTLV